MAFCGCGIAFRLRSAASDFRRDLFFKLARFAPLHLGRSPCGSIIVRLLVFRARLAGIDSRSFLLFALQPFFGFANAALLSAFLKLKELTVTRGRRYRRYLGGNKVFAY